MSFKITPPELNIDKKEVEARNRRMFKEDFEKNGMLAKVMVFIHMYEPLSTSELADKMTYYYQLEHDRVRVFRAVDRLVKLGLIFRVTSGYVLTLLESERKVVHNKILDKHRSFLSRQPKQFQNRYTDVNYFWIKNGEGMKYMEWCCKLLNFKCEKK